ncbi:MAG: NADH-quinone oxidoreductase subunit D [Elusimicrobia bacterium]|nr:NADH-quinone oxidoreductase subunit D [Elusimicrobiota bacterium]
MIKKLHTEEMFLNVGPQHPSTHGVLRLVVTLDGEVLTDVKAHIGYLHRGIEKLAESRTYLQCIVLMDRLDYVSSMTNDMVFCLAVEKLMSIQVPEKAEYMRVIMLELQRMASHLIFFGIYGADIGAISPFFYAFREREMIIDLFESVCGSRLTYNYIRIGGVAKDLPEGWIDSCWKFINWIKPRFKEYNDLLTNNVIFLDRTKNVGTVSKEDLIDFGVSGPMLRASGVKYDIRKDDTYSIYKKFEFDIPTGTNGDCWDRYYVRMMEMEESVRIIEQALKSIPQYGDYTTKTPKTIRPGETYVHVESPKGDLGIFLVSDGTERPYRLKVRTPSFSNLQILKKLLVGRKIADMVAILGSIDIVLGEIDR